MCRTVFYKATKTVRTCLEMPEGARGRGGGGAPASSRWVVIDQDCFSMGGKDRKL